jgi:hypothetical protein
MSNFYGTSCFVNPVVNVNGRMEQAANVGTLLEDCSQVWKLREEIKTIEKVHGKLIGGLWVILHGPRENLLQIS